MSPPRDRRTGEQTPLVVAVFSFSRKENENLILLKMEEKRENRVVFAD
jgi:hypothetical protein